MLDVYADVKPFCVCLQLAEGTLKRTNSMDSGVGMLMNLRKIANHPLLIRNHFDNDQVSVSLNLFLFVYNDPDK
jgi:hypothetical protein